MQTLVSNLSRSLLHCSTEAIRSTIDEGLAQLGAFVEADRAYVFELMPGGSARNTHEWCAPGIKPEIENLQNLPRDTLDFWRASLTKGQPIHLPDVALLGEDNSGEKELLTGQGIQSLLVVPMITSDSLLGLVGFDSVRSRRTYLVEEISLLTWAADIMCAALLREKNASDMAASERELSLEKERFRVIAGTVSDVLWDCDLAGQKWWISRDWPEKLGIQASPEGEDAQTWFGRVLPDDRPKLMASFYQLLKSGKDTWEVDYRFKGNDDQLIDIHVKAAVLRRPDGRVLRMLGNARNVTKDKRNQEGYTRARALEAVGQLTGGIAHDFNNLLMIILGNAEFLEDTALDASQAEAVAMIHQASSSAADLTERLLSFSRQSQLRAGRVVLANLIPRTVTLLRSGIPETITITCDIKQETWDAKVDANALEQAVINLAVNARDAMPSGGEIAISAENQSICADPNSHDQDLVPGDYVVLSVKDDGKGMAPDVLARAFEPFFTTKDVGEGTGLGLSTVFGFAKQSGGHVSIQSALDHGTTVSIYLPRFERGEDQEFDAPKAEQAKGHTGQRILIVEDEPAVRAHVASVLSKLGYVVTAVADGQEALSLLHDGQVFDLLFTDVVMPGKISGPLLGQAALEIAPKIKILYTSGYPAASFENLGIKNPSDVNFLAKPYRNSQLQEKIKEVFNS